MDVKEECGIVDRVKHVPKTSKMRKFYIVRLIMRIIVFIGGTLLLLFKEGEDKVLKGWGFFQQFSAFHILWAVWMFDMILQIFPIRSVLALGSLKLFKFRYKEAKERVKSGTAMREYIKKTGTGALKVLAIYALGVLILSLLKVFGVISDKILFIITLAFYVCDLICVLVWCPFRLIMKTRCCTTCRIFNWDHLMMFVPMITVVGFYSISLIAMAAVVVLVWEFSILLHPERFWEGTNEALRCANCKDKLCTQYCERNKTKNLTDDSGKKETVASGK